MRYFAVAVFLAVALVAAGGVNRHNRRKGTAARLAALRHTRLVVVATPEVAEQVFGDNGGDAA